MDSEQSTDEVTQRQIEYVVEKWAIPKYEAKRMLKNHQATN
ncbi:hypothetical protein [Halorubrum sp. DTA46]